MRAPLSERGPLKRLFVFVVAFAGAVAGVVSLGAQAHNGLSFSAFGTATIDGVLAPGEWDGAARFDLPVNVPEGGTTPGTLLVMNDGVNLYLAFRLARTTADMTTVAVEFDNDHDGGGFAPENGDDGLVVNSSSPGTLSDNFRIRCTPPGGTTGFCGPGDMSPASPGVVYPDGLPAPGTIDGKGAFRNDGTFSVFEISHPLDSADNAHDFSLKAGDTVGILRGNVSIIAGGVQRETVLATGGDIVVAAPPAAGDAGPRALACASKPVARANGTVGIAIDLDKASFDSGSYMGATFTIARFYRGVGATCENRGGSPTGETELGYPVWK